MGGELQHRQLIENPMEEKGRKLEEEDRLSSSQSLRRKTMTSQNA